MKNWLLVSALLSGINGFAAGQSVPAAAPPTYIFSTFSGDRAEDMRLRIYTSTDATNFTLYANTGYGGPPGCSLRDPSIMTHSDGRYYVVFTAPPYNRPYANQNFVGLAWSTNLQSWNTMPSIYTTNIPGVKLSWAPEWVVDGSGVPKFIVHCSSASSDLRPYLYTATNRDLTGWSGPVDIGIGSMYLDGQILKVGNTWHCFIKSNLLQHATAPAITGPWTWLPNRSDWANLEGPCAVQLSNGSWIMHVDPMYDVAQYMTSLDLTNWSALMYLPGPGKIIKHGTIIRDDAFNLAPMVASKTTSLAHRYSFSETAGTTVADSVGGVAWNGTLPNGGMLGGGRLALSAASSQYLRLPAGLLSNYAAVTIEAWVTLPSPLPDNCFFFGFGNSSGGSGDGYIFCQPKQGRIAITPSNYSEEQSTAPNPSGNWSLMTNLHLTAVFNMPQGVLALYTNGVLAARNSSASTPLNALNDVFSYVGRSLYSSDPYFDMNLDELRIYSGALSASEIATSHTLGPNHLLPLPSAGVAASSPGPATPPKSFISYFLSTPPHGGLSREAWGAANVLPRDPRNGLEDNTITNYCYWDGQIIKSADGKYHMFASRWDESKGHGGWWGSVAVHAVSDSLTGPYLDKGLCWPMDQGGKGHNVTALTLPDGRYAIVISETRPCEVYVSHSLDGPWEHLGTITVEGDPKWHASNVSIMARPDGNFEFVPRNGEIFFSDKGILGPYRRQGGSVFPKGIPHLEDPCIWFSGGLYHIVVNSWSTRVAYHLTSRDGIHDWTNRGVAYDPRQSIVRYPDGTVNHWNKAERPSVYIEHGHVVAMTLAVIDVEKEREKGRDGHGSKVIVLPFDGAALDRDLRAATK